MIYSTIIGGIPAESEEVARRKAELLLPRLLDINDEGWSNSEPETTVGPPQIIAVGDEAEIVAWLPEIRGSPPPTSGESG